MIGEELRIKKKSFIVYAWTEVENNLQSVPSQQAFSYNTDFFSSGDINVHFFKHHSDYASDS